MGLVDSLLNVLKDLIISGEKTQLSSKDIWWLMEKLIDSKNLSVNCPVAQLPLEILVAEWCEDIRHSGVPQSGAMSKLAASPLESSKKIDAIASLQHDDTFNLIESKWPEIVAATKSYNHSLMAVLKAGSPKGISGNVLTIGVLYKFHKDKLEEPKNRDTLEKVISDIIGTVIEVKFELLNKN